MPKHFVSNADVSVRMFRSDFVERCSHVHPIVPHVLYVPVIAWLLWRAPTSVGHGALLVVAGLALWTLVEYVMHKHAFHAPDHVMTETHDIVARLPREEPVFPALPGWRHKIYFLAHGVHHEYPSDTTRLVMPPGASIPLALLFYVAFRLLAGPAQTPALFAGFLVGYLIYDTVHYAVHHPGLPTAFGRYLKKRHHHHHFVDPDSDYGVSSPLWDAVFGTLPPNERARRSA
jgi:4-hydroxysphinganine ceramide fatty acyl 2-hydroxylase